MELTFRMQVDPHMAYQLLERLQIAIVKGAAAKMPMNQDVHLYCTLQSLASARADACAAPELRGLIKEIAIPTT